MRNSYWPSIGNIVQYCQILVWSRIFFFFFFLGGGGGGEIDRAPSRRTSHEFPQALSAQILAGKLLGSHCTVQHVGLSNCNKTLVNVELQESGRVSKRLHFPHQIASPWKVWRGICSARITYWWCPITCRSTRTWTNPCPTTSSTRPTTPTSWVSPAALAILLVSPVE